MKKRGVMMLTCTVLLAGALLASAQSAEAQSFGTFSWNLSPFIDVVQLAITQDGPDLRLVGSDTSPGDPRFPAYGTGTFNPDGSVSFGFTLIFPQGVPLHVRADIDPGTGDGVWEGDLGPPFLGDFLLVGGPYGTARADQPGGSRLRDSVRRGIRP